MFGYKKNYFQLYFTIVFYNCQASKGLNIIKLKAEI